MRIKVGQLKPNLFIECLSDGNPLDLTGATVTFLGYQGIGLLINDTSPTVSAAAGKVTHVWTAGETDTRGRVFYQVKVNQGDGKFIYFPSYGFEVCDIED